MQLTSQYRVDAPVEWVRSFLLAGTAEANVTVEDDVVEVRQRDRLIDLVVRNTVTADGAGGTLLEVDARLRLRGLARVVGAVFAGRVRRALGRSLDGLPEAIERSLEESDAAADDGGMVEGPAPPPSQEAESLTVQRREPEADAADQTPSEKPAPR